MHPYRVAASGETRRNIILVNKLRAAEDSSVSRSKRLQTEWTRTLSHSLTPVRKKRRSRTCSQNACRRNLEWVSRAIASTLSNEHERPEERFPRILTFRGEIRSHWANAHKPSGICCSASSGTAARVDGLFSVSVCVRTDYSSGRALVRRMLFTNATRAEVGALGGTRSENCCEVGVVFRLVEGVYSAAKIS